jgi:hypothetical protein
MGGLALVLALPACFALTTLSASRLDLVHLDFFNSCAMRSYALHLQDQRRYPQPIRYDFITSPVSVVTVVVWVENGPTINWSQPVPVSCS